MERYRDDHIGLKMFLLSLDKPEKVLCKKPAERRQFLIFQKQNRTRHLGRVQGETAGKGKIVKAFSANAA